METEYDREIQDVLKVYEDRKKRRSSLFGHVVSTKCSKSIVVRVESRHFNRKYQVMVRKHSRIMAHDPDQKGMVGDFVQIIQCRPMSRKKRHALLEILHRPQSAQVSLYNPTEDSNFVKFVPDV